MYWIPGNFSLSWPLATHIYVREWILDTNVHRPYLWPHHHTWWIVDTDIHISSFLYPCSCRGETNNWWCDATSHRSGVAYSGARSWWAQTEPTRAHCHTHLHMRMDPRYKRTHAYMPKRTHTVLMLTLPHTLRYVDVSVLHTNVHAPKLLPTHRTYDNTAIGIWIDLSLIQTYTHHTYA